MNLFDFQTTSFFSKSTSSNSLKDVLTKNEKIKKKELCLKLLLVYISSLSHKKKSTKPMSLEVGFYKIEGTI